MPGTAEIDVSRESLANYVRENKRVITAYLDERQNRWKEGQGVHLTSKGYLRTDANEIEEDFEGRCRSLRPFEVGCKQTGLARWKSWSRGNVMKVRFLWRCAWCPGRILFERGAGHRRPRSAP